MLNKCQLWLSRRQGFGGPAERTAQDELILVGPGLLQEPNHPCPGPRRGACRELRPSPSRPPTASSRTGAGPVSGCCTVPRGSHAGCLLLFSSPRSPTPPPPGSWGGGGDLPGNVIRGQLLPRWGLLPGQRSGWTGVRTGGEPAWRTQARCRARDRDNKTLGEEGREGRSRQGPHTPQPSPRLGFFPLW